MFPKHFPILWNVNLTSDLDPILRSKVNDVLALVLKYPKFLIFCRPWPLVLWEHFLDLLNLQHPRAKLYSSIPSIWFVTWYPLDSFLILHLMTPENPRAGLYSSKPSIWYVTQYPLGNLHFMTPEHPRAELYSSRPSIWYVTRYPSGNFLILHLITPEHPQAGLYLA
jgi:hypothetical protein